MRTVNEVSKLTGISVRTLHYYDQIGLLKPSQVTEAGYRLYDDTALEKLIQFARGIKALGVKYMDFSVFDTKKLDKYAEEAKKNWGKTDAYKEYEEKTKCLSKSQQNQMGSNLMELFVEFGAMVRDGASPADDTVQAQVKKLQDYITENFYTCTDEILSGLGKMYAGGGDFTINIDNANGVGTAAFVNEAIEIYCK